MKNFVMRLFEDVIPASSAPVHLPAVPRSIFVHTGNITVEHERGSQYQVDNTAWVGSDELTLLPGTQKTIIWRWELVSNEVPCEGELRSAPACKSQLKLQHTVELDPNFSWLMRCDSVGFPPGGVALTHVHQGPGIRCVYKGEIAIETEGTRGVFGPGEAWMEKGYAPVLAPTTKDTETLFIRCFILPRGSRSRSSIRYVRPEDAALPKVQSYHVFAEQFIELP